MSGRSSWSNLLSGLVGEAVAPSLVGMRSNGLLGDRCAVTAGFRDQFYGLIPFVAEADELAADRAGLAPLLTSGSIDPASSRWGVQRARYAGRWWGAPVVDRDAVASAGGALARWLAGKQVPKVLVAAQTRTIEAVADVSGAWVPSTPVATLVPEGDEMWPVLAVLLSPVATAWAVRHLRGSALNAGSLRLPPSFLRSLPTPAGGAAWDRAAEAVRTASTSTAEPARARHLHTAATEMCEAYGIDPQPATAWWAQRLPRR